MSYNLTLECGCIVYVSCNPTTGVAHTRVLDRRGLACPVRKRCLAWALELGAASGIWGGTTEDERRALRRAAARHRNRVRKTAIHE